MATASLTKRVVTLGTAFVLLLAPCSHSRASGSDDEGLVALRHFVTLSQRREEIPPGVLAKTRALLSAVTPESFASLADPARRISVAALGWMQMSSKVSSIAERWSTLRVLDREAIRLAWFAMCFEWITDADDMTVPCKATSRCKRSLAWAKGASVDIAKLASLSKAEKQRLLSQLGALRSHGQLPPAAQSELRHPLLWLLFDTSHADDASRLAAAAVLNTFDDKDAVGLQAVALLRSHWDRWTGSERTTGLLAVSLLRVGPGNSQVAKAIAELAGTAPAESLKHATGFLESLGAPHGARELVGLWETRAESDRVVLLGSLNRLLGAHGTLKTTTSQWRSALERLLDESGD